MFGWLAITPTVVVTRYHVEPAHDARKPIEIVGRASGIIGWLLTTLRLSDEMCLTVTSTDVAFKRASLKGELQDLVPLVHVASTTYGYAKPLWLLVLGAVALIMGVRNFGDSNMTAFVYLVVAAASLIRYFLQQTTLIQVETTGGGRLALSFKRSVIENVNIDLAAAQRIAGRLNHAVLAANGTHRPAVRRSA